MSALTIRAWVERFAQGGAELRPVIEGLTPSELDARPGPGAWSLRELVVHLMDSELVGADRMKRVVAEDAPTLLAYDENRWLDRLGYASCDAWQACELFEANRRWLAELLRSLPDDAFGRTGDHTERGVMTLADLVKGYTEHFEHHLRFAHDKRSRLGKPL
jgi:uncharacterized damage-inducible protein DinB